LKHNNVKLTELKIKLTLSSCFNKENFDVLAEENSANQTFYRQKHKVWIGIFCLFKLFKLFKLSKKITN